MFQNFAPLQQDAQKDTRTSNQTGAIDFSLGTSPKFDLAKFQFNESKNPLLSFDPTRPLQGLSSLSAGLDHLKQRDSGVSKTTVEGIGGGTDHLGKRNQFNKDDDENLSKKFKQNPVKNIDAPSYSSQFNPPFGTAAGNKNLSDIDIKDEGGIQLL